MVVDRGPGCLDVIAGPGAPLQFCETTLPVLFAALVGPVKTFPYFFSVAASAAFLLGWLWFFLPDITIPQGLVGVVLALALRRILYAGLIKYTDSRSRKRGP
jgi:hypothetical protein